MNQRSKIWSLLLPPLKNHSLFFSLRHLGQVLVLALWTLIKTLLYVVCILAVGSIVNYIITGKNIAFSIGYNFDASGFSANYESNSIFASITCVAVSLCFAYNFMQYLLNVVLAMQMVRYNSLSFRDARRKSYEVLIRNKIFVFLPALVFLFVFPINATIIYVLSSLLSLPWVVVYVLTIFFVIVELVYIWLLLINVSRALRSNS